MANISDIIEKFILSNIGDDSNIQLSRNELAGYFRCAPSQINYVLSTRFTPERGYVVEGRRGGGGYITVLRIKTEGSLYDCIKKTIGDSLTAREAAHILERLHAEGLTTLRETNLIAASVGDRALSGVDNADKARANILKTILLELLK